MRKSIAIIVTVMMVIAAYVFFISPLAEKRSVLKESLELKYATLQKYEAFLKDSGSAETDQDLVIKEIEKTEANIIQEANDSVASAKLQGYIQDFAVKSGIKINSIKPLTVVKYKHYAELSVQLEANGGIVQLSDFLRMLESGKQIVSIDKLNVSVMNMQMPWDLKIRMQVSGLKSGTTRSEKI